MKAVAEKNLAPLKSEELQRMWGSLNALYFDARLPPIEIQWSTRLTSSVGLFVSETGPRTQHVSLETRHGAGRVIRLSLPLLRAQPLEEIRGTLAHEMIHQWQFDVKKCHPSHGREFRRMMKIMNQDGLGITVYHTLTKEVAALSKYTWECQKCGRAYHRQRKSLSSQTHRCGACWGELQEVSSGPSWSRLRGEVKSKPSVSQRVNAHTPIQMVFDFMSDLFSS
jgi:predicted SprT family Zn-dependent metalloprotease